jgi:hypothetical protein
METSYHDMEEAFLDWLNQLKITHEEITSLTQLKDGIILMKLLNIM